MCIRNNGFCFCFFFFGFYLSFLRKSLRAFRQPFCPISDGFPPTSALEEGNRPPTKKKKRGKEKEKEKEKEAVEAPTREGPRPSILWHSPTIFAMEPLFLSASLGANHLPPPPTPRPPVATAENHGHAAQEAFLKASSAPGEQDGQTILDTSDLLVIDSTACEHSPELNPLTEPFFWFFFFFGTLARKSLRAGQTLAAIFRKRGLLLDLPTGRICGQLSSIRGGVLQKKKILSLSMFFSNPLDFG